MDRSSALRGLRTVRNRSKLWHSPWNEDQAGFHRERHPPPSTSRAPPPIYSHQCHTNSPVLCGWGRRVGVTLQGGIHSLLLQIIDDKGNSLPFNTEGNTGIRMKPTKPIGLFMGYEDNPVKTAEVACGDFYNSGDRATMDEEGYIWFLGRNDDIINASGYRIGPAEVENALAEHPAVAESAVVSSLDPIRREVRRRTQRSSCLCVGTKAGAGKPSSRSCLSNLGPRVEGGPRGVHVHLHCVATREQCGLNHV
uniref:acyl-coenzyme A synthetase ACSM1, mitochondrial-like isoform X4 n=1 Tax=Halichoerus grypus TaxID=9711 RepID=UPI001659C34D|nr:acyl-coenzyme A synthetase ACSM1, mitochondrial-like isoform X4 [Halichoerus grypus]